MVPVAVRKLMPVAVRLGGVLSEELAVSAVEVSTLPPTETMPTVLGTPTVEVSEATPALSS